ncbi:hypothetical protein GQ457_04G003530 [Hibiscus cannabinus]
MDEEYDVIVLGTGLKECILSGVLSVDGLKVLHMDRNDYYGGESTSLNLVQFMMANGTLVRILIHTKVTKYLNFKAVDGSYVYNKKKIYKVPATDVEALKSPLMGLFEKRRARKFFIYVQDYDENDPKSHEKLDLNKVTARELISKYGLEDDTIDFIGHALALHKDDSYLDQPALSFVKRMKLYAESLARFQGGSPYIYPLYGLGELPQAFARLSAVYGGTYMLNKPECKVEFDDDGKVIGVTSEGETAKCKKVVCDPSYLSDRVKKVGKVARAICIMSHPIPDTKESHSAQVILPQKQLGRKSDMYLFCCSYAHNVAPKGKYIAFVSAEAETDNPEAELKPGVDLLGTVEEIFYDTYDRYVPTNDHAADNCFISSGDLIMSRRASQKRQRFDVFDFTDGDERVEREPAAIPARFKNPNHGRKAISPLNKQDFLQCFARKSEISNRPIDIDEVAGCSSTKKMEASNVLIELDSEVTEPQLPWKNEIGNRQIDLDVEALQSRKTRKKKKTDEAIDVDAKEVQVTKTAERQFTFPASRPVKHERVSVLSDDGDGIEIISSSAFASSPVECRDYSEEQLSVHASKGHEIEREYAKVVISPDFMFYRGMHCTEGQLTFSKTCLKFEGSAVNGTKKKFSFVWTVDDVISIDVQWCERVETAIMNLVLQSKNSKKVGNANETSAIGLLKFSVCDPCWYEREKSIKSLSVRYKDIWHTISDENEENAFMGQCSRSLSKSYFSDFHEHFEEVIYPKGDPDAISISNRDVALLQPQTFINDTIIDFYIKYLQNKIQHEEQHKFHFFNSFFFRKLADVDKDLSSACQARAAFERVRKWTRKVDIFEKDYIFIPVNYSLHWSLIVICHPGEVANFKDGKAENLHNVPCILHMNSIRGSHRGLKNLFQSYLSEEWKERHIEMADGVSSNFLHLQFVQLELPQQENSFDCGLFLLHYMELFLHQASTNFCPFKLNRHWFPPVEASLKRSHIKKLIYEILEEQSRSSASGNGIYNDPSSLIPGQSEQETAAQIGNSAETCHGYSSNSTVKHGPNSFLASPPIVQKGHKDSGLGSFKFYVETGGGLFSHGNYQQIDTLGKRSSMSPIEETEETSEEIAGDLPLDLDGQQVVWPVTESCLNIRYPSKDFRSRTPCKQKIPMHFEGSALNKLIDSLESSELRLEDDEHLPEFEVSSQRGESDHPEHCLTSNESGSSDCMVEGSQESNSTHNDIEFESISSPSFRKDTSAVFNQQEDITTRVGIEENVTPTWDGDHVSKGDEQQVSEAL